MVKTLGIEQFAPMNHIYRFYEVDDYMKSIASYHKTEFIIVERGRRKGVKERQQDLQFWKQNEL